ncbi:MAG: hypothetical protein WBZ48_08150 [Bacteroidota bacterium]
MDNRTTASFGKRQEYIAVAELLRRGFDVYMTLVDDQQIDCVIRQKKGKVLRYLDVQVKARSNRAKHGATFSALRVRNPRPNFWFIFYSELANTYWIMPSLDLVKLANVNKGGKNKKGKNKGKFSIVLANKNKSGWKPRPKFNKYENAFDDLRWDV